MKNQKGITLVALVVTIIVLLILAGVSLSLVAGSDGILGKASGAVDKHLIASIKEKVELKVGEEVENFYEAKYVNRTINNNETAYQYLAGTATDETTTDNKANRRIITEGAATYTITCGDSNLETVSGKPAKYLITVNYTNGKTIIDGAKKNDGSENAKATDNDKELRGYISENGSITWNSDLDNDSKIVINSPSS